MVFFSTSHFSSKHRDTMSKITALADMNATDLSATVLEEQLHKEPQFS